MGIQVSSKCSKMHGHANFRKHLHFVWNIVPELEATLLSPGGGQKQTPLQPLSPSPKHPGPPLPQSWGRPWTSVALPVCGGCALTSAGGGPSRALGAISSQTPVSGAVPLCLGVSPWSLSGLVLVSCGPFLGWVLD